jgi:hypothetical protein
VSEPQQVTVVRPILRTGLMVGGCVLVLAGLFVTLLVVGMFVQPGGMGAEELLEPIFGFFALLLLFGGGVSFYLGWRVKAGAGTS